MTGLFRSEREIGYRPDLLVILLFVLILVLGLLTLALENSRGDTVEITLSVLADSASAAGVLLENSNLFKGLKNLALDGTCKSSNKERVNTAAKE